MGHFVPFSVRAVVVAVIAIVALVRLFARVDAGVDLQMLRNLKSRRTLFTPEGLILGVTGSDVLFHVAFPAEAAIAVGTRKGPCRRMTDEVVFEVKLAEEPLFAVRTSEGTFSAVLGSFVDG